VREAVDALQSLTVEERAKAVNKGLPDVV